ncbi:MAG: hypothetical protein V1494_06840 [Candidatus Diapherotrites archaeon]
MTEETIFFPELKARLGTQEYSYKVDDINFLLEKTKFLEKQCLATHNFVFEKIKENAINDMMRRLQKNKDDFKFSTAVQHKVVHSGHVRVFTDFAFSFDSFIETCIRAVRYQIKLSLEVLLGDEVESLQKLMKALIENTEKYNAISERLEKQEPELKKYYIEQWQTWVEGLNKKRVDIVHYFIMNKYEVKATAFWSCMEKEVGSPTRIDCIPMQIDGKPLDSFIRETKENVCSFINFNVNYLIEKKRR